ncbi:3830_t:CDS:2, partial [Scutellospora calospora]
MQKWNEESRNKVYTGTLFFVSVGATCGGLVAFFNNRSFFRYTIATGINCGIFGLSFFSIRELCLLHQQKNKYKLRNSRTQNIDELISSIIAGGLTGGLFSTIIRDGVGHVCYTSAYNYRQQLILKPKNVQYTPNSQNQEILNNVNLESKDKKMTKGLFDWLSTKKWTGVKKLSEEEYKQIKQSRAEAKTNQLGNISTKYENSDDQS